MSPITDPCTSADWDPGAIPHETIYVRVRAALAAVGATEDERDEIAQAAVAEAWFRDAAIEDRHKVVSYTVTIAMRYLAAARHGGACLSPLTVAETVLMNEADDPGARLERAELGERVADALMQLAERDRHLVLANFEGVDVDTIAAATGLKRESVATSTYRAKMRLRAHLVGRGLSADGLAA